MVDEGGAVISGKMFGIKGNIGMIGICEKGYADIKITAKHEGGHSSQPPKNNGLVQVCKAIVKLEKKQFKKRLIKPVEATFTELCKYMNFGMKIIISNLWITKSLLLSVFAKSKQINAMITTTIAPTMAEGSMASNILPQTANITVNFRILQGETIQDVKNHIKKAVKNDNLELDFLRGKQPSAVSPLDSLEINIIKKSLRLIKGKIPIAPYIMVGGTDSCYFESICDNIYRISPFTLGKKDLTRIHGTNERIEKNQLEDGIRFFMQLINNYCK